MKHSGNGAVVDGLVGADRFGVVFLHDLVDVAEGSQAVLDVAIVARGR